jgi:hypothetical protein
MEAVISSPASPTPTDGHALKTYRAKDAMNIPTTIMPKF